MIVQVPNVLSPDDIRRCRDALASATWQGGRQTAGSLAARVKDNQQLAHDDPVARQLSNLIVERLSASERFIAAALPLKVLPPLFNRYTGDGSYGDHIDNSIFTVPGTPVRIRGDLSATLFLTDPDEYDGGELSFQSDLGRQTVKLPAGYMILYPASTVHRVSPVTRGARMSSFFWIQSLVREHDRRAMLLELDDTIRELAIETPEAPAVLKLTGLYHNLLRTWSDT